MGNNKMVFDYTIYKEYEAIIKELINRAGSCAIYDEEIDRAVETFEQLSMDIGVVKFDKPDYDPKYIDKLKKEFSFASLNLLFVSAQLYGITIAKYIRHFLANGIPGESR